MQRRQDTEIMFSEQEVELLCEVGIFYIMLLSQKMLPNIVI